MLQKSNSNATRNHGRQLRTVSFVVAAFVVFGLLKTLQASSQSTPASTSLPSFEVASVKPNRSGDNSRSIFYRPGRFTATGATLRSLITLAYKVKDFQVSGGPSWIDTERYNIDAKEEDSLARELDKLPPDQRMEKYGLLIRSLLADRFQLKIHTEARTAQPLL